MGSNFHETMYDKRFFEGQLPCFIKAINRLAESIEKQNELKQKEKKDEKSDKGM